MFLGSLQCASGSCCELWVLLLFPLSSHQLSLCHRLQLRQWPIPSSFLELAQELGSFAMFVLQHFLPPYHLYLGRIPVCFQSVYLCGGGRGPKCGRFVGVSGWPVN
jgi:hypothetical protein